LPLPIVYNIRSVRERWTSSLVAIVGIAGAVGVFVAMLALARGFQATLVSSGQPDNVIVEQAGADTEMTSALDLDAVHAIENAPYIKRQGRDALISPEVVVVANLQLRGPQGGDANVEVRGVATRVLSVRDNVHVVQGRFFTPGLYEIVVGKHATLAYAGLELGGTVRIGPGSWKVVGIFDSGGSAFDSEVWADSNVLNANYQRPNNVFQSVTVKLGSASDFDAFNQTVTHNPHLQVQALREREYYANQSRTVTTLITVLGGLVALVMGLGAILAALNTMYASVSERSREIAVLRAIGFGSGSIVLSFVSESLWIALVGGLAGCLAVLPINGITTGTMNWQTFAHLSFAFRITGDLLGLGLVFALIMGVVGGLPPAIRAARANVATTLRAL
jgi:putative ABC transport system permease protein